MTASGPTAGPTDGRLDVRLLGPVELFVDGRPVLVRRGRQQLLLAALALRPGQVVASARLMEELWPAGLPDAPENALQQVVSAIRRCLGPVRGLLTTEPSGYRLAVPAETTDVGRAEAAADRASRLLSDGASDPAQAIVESALAGWRGRALDGILGGQLEGPLLVQVERLRALRARLEGLAADCALTTGDPRSLEAAARRLTAATADHPFDESLWERRIAVLAQAGRPAEALRVYDTARRALADELGVDPNPALRALHTRLLTEVLAEEDDVPPGAARTRDHSSAAAIPASPIDLVWLGPLPRLPESRLVGREPDLAQLASWRDAGARLVTILGPAGIGKTRLALENAHRIDGPVAMVLLDGLPPDSDVAAAIAAAVRLREVGVRDMTDVLAQSLPAGTTLVLDNAEHVLGQVATVVAALLDRTADLSVVVTSQWPLGLPTEHQLRLGPLTTTEQARPRSQARPDQAPGEPLADTGTQADTGTPADTGAPADLGALLLLDRASQVQPALCDPTADETVAAHRIAALLDGVPLALELAAAQARHLSLPQLAASLADSLDLLERDTLRVAARHRRLTDAVDWSLRLLHPEHLDVFLRCAILAGVFDADLAAAVTGLSKQDTLSALLDLADRSVVHVVADQPRSGGHAAAAGPRFCLLRPLRQHAARRLEREGRGDMTRDRLLAWVMDVTERGDGGLRGRDQVAWLARLDAARADIENALTYAVSTGRLDTASRVVAALGRYWDWRGRLRDMERWTALLMDAVPRTTGSAPPGYGTVAAWRGFAAIERGDPDAGASWADQGLEIARRSGDRDAETTCLAILSLVPDTHTARALKVLGATLELADDAQDRWARAWVVNRRGYVHLLSGNLDGADADATTSHDLFESLGDRRATCWADHLTATVAHHRGDPQRAAALADSTLTTSRALGDLRAAALAATLLAAISQSATEREALQRLSRRLLQERSE